jgi:hypothetical protein
MKRIKNLKKSEIINPPCTRYNPKYDYILKAAKALPLWEKTTGRIYPKKDTFEHNFYLQHDNIEDTMAGKTFIDMSKQSKRSFDINDSLNRCTNSSNNNTNRPHTSKIKDFSNKNKKYSKIIPHSFIQNISENKNKKKLNILSKLLRNNYFRKQKFNKTLKEAKKNFLNNTKIDKSTNNNRIKSTNINEISNNNMTNNNNKDNIRKNEDNKENMESNNLSKDSYDIFKHIYLKKKKQKNKNKLYYTNRSCGYIEGNSLLNVKKTIKKKIKAPDFEKCISREFLDRIEESKIAVSPYLLPNYECVRAKPIMMVVYDRKKHKINRAKSASLMRVDNSFYYDQSKAIECVNNHISIHPPNFNLMTSRPDGKEALPSFMKKIFNKNSCYGISEKSLILNNYKNGEYMAFKSSFRPKMSFNKVINKNLLKSKKFAKNISFNGNSIIIKNNVYGASLKYYMKNYKDILKKKILPKFDNAILKSIGEKTTNNINEIINNRGYYQ